MNSNDWVAEHVMGFERGSCQGTMGGGNASSDGTYETWFDCGWCGQTRYNGKTGPCPEYPFPKFTLVDLVRKLGEKGYHVTVYVGPENEHHEFTVVVNHWRVCDTDSPLESLCSDLYRKREIWQRFEKALGPYHGPRKPEKKRFVGGEQVLEEYIPNYERPRGLVDWGLLRSLGKPQICSIVCRICPYTTPLSRLANGCRWCAGIPAEPEPIVFANIRDAIKLLRKAMGQANEG